ncbi:NDP-hexose 2,3-dehydratase family protein [Actinomadura sp. DC4]|uniref:NDP-hexose 2,3-dehydratase family protein n=1 Tax=Actinomadura sp. DC4 TaxID=3055069 RepID=UPI0025AF22F8|nr:NDP-hexose 2,3-dehydratase family protein [Actinomadura sp. DC4]MDN3355690.1 NDP-hexose 2,3-dehydratase family protein [Actinomadura sp. DC4]
MIAPLTRERGDGALPARITRSAAARHGVSGDVHDFHAWFAGRRAATRFAVDRIPFDALDGWSFQEGTGDLVHRSGRFFTVEGLRVEVGDPRTAQWQQPIIRQPEVGILGIVAREFDGVLHFLMQAKMEPGNPNLLQLSPTVQATRSNYTGVHRGAAVRHLEHFIKAENGRVLSDVLQSEHGSWFYRKRNRNMIVEVSGDVAPHEDFRWLTLGQISELMRHDNLINMDSRSVLAGLSADCTPRALHSDTDLLSWLAAMRSAHIVRAECGPLSGVSGWVRGASSIDHEHGRYFRVVAVAVQAGNREVAQWTQPLFEPLGEGIVAFLTREIEGVPHALVRACPEAGFLDTVELGPTVQCTPANYAHLPAGERPAFLDVVTAPDPDRVRYSALHSEEGGRFLNAVSRYLVVEADESTAPLVPPPGFRWVSHGQLAEMARHGHYVSVQARTLLACLNALAADALTVRA